MKKVGIILILGAGVMIFSSLGFLYYKENSIAPSPEIVIPEDPVIEPQVAQEALDGSEIVRQKIENIRKRLALKGLIIEGDSYYRGGQLPLALKKYNEFYKKNPKDSLIIEKLGDTYSEMKKFTSAYNYYSKIQSEQESLLEKKVESFFYTMTLSDTNSYNKNIETLENMGLDSEQLFYYKTSYACIYDFHACKKSFGNYFWPENDENNTGDKQLTYSKMTHIRKSIENYRNFQNDDVYLKDAFIIGSWYSDRMYNISAYMGEQLLKEKVGYKPILKIVAQSYFELGEYEKARIVLGQYYEIDDEDPAIAYMLGIVNTKLREYVLANIYLSKSIDLSYTQANNARRQLIHNFYILENDENMLREFVSLIQDDEFTSNDLSLGIYYHIVHEELQQALAWARKGKELFGEEIGDFYAYEGWILREQGNIEESSAILNTGIELHPEDPFILINLGYNALELGNKGEAIIYFKTILKLAPKSEFAINAQKEIEKLTEK